METMGPCLLFQQRGGLFIRFKEYRGVGIKSGIGEFLLVSNPVQGNGIREY
jgi:hypothetical protein